VFKTLLLTISLLFLASCVGVIEEVPTPKEHVTDKPPAITFRGIEDAIAIAHDRVVLRFKDTLESAKIKFNVYRDGIFLKSYDVTSIENTKDYDGMYNVTVGDLQVGRTYTFAVKAYDDQYDREYLNERTSKVTTLDYLVPHFNGLNVVRLPSGITSRHTVVLEWGVAEAAIADIFGQSDDVVKGFYIYRSEDPSTLWQETNKIDEVDADTLTYVDAYAIESNLLLSESERINKETTFYYGVRAYNNIGVEDKNVFTKEITTDGQDVLYEFAGPTALETIHAFQGFNKLALEWAQGKGRFDRIRAVFKVLSDEDVTTGNFGNPADYPFTTADIEADPEYDYWDFLNMNALGGDILNLESQETYGVVLAACNGDACDGSYSARSEQEAVMIGSTTPRVAVFGGVKAARVDPFDTGLTTAIVDYEAVDLNTGAYDLDGTNSALEFYQLAKPSNPFSCDEEDGWGLPLPSCQDEPTAICYLGSRADDSEAKSDEEFRKYHRRIMNLDYGKTYCFGAKAYYTTRKLSHLVGDTKATETCSDGEYDVITGTDKALFGINPERRGLRYRELNQSVRCVKIEWSSPIFFGIRNCEVKTSYDGSKYLNVEWVLPDSSTNPIYTGFRVLFKKKDADTANMMNFDKLLDWYANLADPYDDFTGADSNIIDWDSGVRAPYMAENPTDLYVADANLMLTNNSAPVYYYSMAGRTDTKVKLLNLPPNTYEVMVKAEFTDSEANPKALLDLFKFDNTAVAVMDCTIPAY